MYIKFIDHTKNRFERVIQCDSYDVEEGDSKKVVRTYSSEHDKTGQSWIIGEGCEFQIAYVMNEQGNTFAVIK